MQARLRDYAGKCSVVCALMESRWDRVQLDPGMEGLGCKEHVWNIPKKHI